MRGHRGRMRVHGEQGSIQRAELLDSRRIRAAPANALAWQTLDFLQQQYLRNTGGSADRPHQYEIVAIGACADRRCARRDASPLHRRTAKHLIELRERSAVTSGECRHAARLTVDGFNRGARVEGRRPCTQRLEDRVGGAERFMFDGEIAAGRKTLRIGLPARDRPIGTVRSDP